MKKFAIVIMILGLLTLAACSPQESREVENEATVKGGAKTQMAVAADEQNATESDDLLDRENKVERTVDLMGKSPFYEIDQVTVNKWIDDGEVVFIIEDGEILEERIASGFEMWEKRVEVSKKYRTKEELETMRPIEFPSFEIEIDLFAKNILRDYPEKEEYIEKLREANALLAPGNEDKVQTALKEAKALREQ